MRKNNARNRVIEIALERLHELFRSYTRDIGMLALAKYLHAVVGKVFEETVERKARTIDVYLAQFAIEISIVVDQPYFQPISIF